LCLRRVRQRKRGVRGKRMMYPAPAPLVLRGGAKMHRHGISKACVVAALLALVALPVRAASAPAVPADARLDPVRTQLQATVDQAAQSGLPAEALISKVQEGLAKNVAPARILQVVSALAADYAAARAYAAQLSPGGKPQAALLRALVDARAAGIKWSDAAPLLRAASAVGAGAAGAAVPGSRIDGPTRAITVLTDLAVRGYPTDHAVAVVSAVLTSD